MFVGTFVNGNLGGPCWKFSASSRFYFGHCDSSNRFVYNSDVIVGSPHDDEVFSCKVTNEKVKSIVMTLEVRKGPVVVAKL